MNIDVAPQCPDVPAAAEAEAVRPTAAEFEGMAGRAEALTQAIRSAKCSDVQRSATHALVRTIMQNNAPAEKHGLRDRMLRISLQPIPGRSDKALPVIQRVRANA